MATEQEIKQRLAALTPEDWDDWGDLDEVRYAEEMLETIRQDFEGILVILDPETGFRGDPDATAEYMGQAIHFFRFLAAREGVDWQALVEQAGKSFLRAIPRERTDATPPEVVAKNGEIVSETERA